jgi:hypothetical protein
MRFSSALFVPCRRRLSVLFYATSFMPGGCHVPSPGGKIEGGSVFIIPHYPQTSLEEVGMVYSSAGLHAPHVMVDGKLITGQNQQSASEYGIALFHVLTGQTAVG